MVTKEEWAELDKKIAAWDKFEQEKTAAKARAAAQRALDDAKCTPEQLRKPTTI